MTAISTTLISDLRHVVVAFDAAVDPDTMPADAWSITPPANAMPATVTLVSARAGNTTLDLLVGAALSATKTYTFTVTGGYDALGAAIIAPDNVGSAAAPNVDEPSSEWAHPYLDALTQGLGEELQVLAGRPVTQLLHDLDPFASVAFVVSTLGFPAAGAFFCGGRRYTYASKTDVSLVDISPDHNDGQTLPAGTEAHCDARAV